LKESVLSIVELAQVSRCAIPQTVAFHHTIHSSPTESLIFSLTVTRITCHGQNVKTFNMGFSQSLYVVLRFKFTGGDKRDRGMSLACLPGQCDD